MRGSRCNLVIRQGQEEGYKPVLYIESTGAYDELEVNLAAAVAGDLGNLYPGIRLVPVSDKQWRLDIPEEYKVGHEAHFAQVMEKYLEYMEKGNMPEWEVPNMIAKYYITTRSLELTR
jgi:hypothetical protein